MRHTLLSVLGITLSMAAAQADAADFSITPTTVSGIFRWSVQIGTGTAPKINPVLHLIRGHSYAFDITTSGSHPFWIKTASSAGSGNAYTGGGLSANGITTTTTITFMVPQNAPDSLFYNCASHSTMAGAIDVSIFRDAFGG